MTHIILCIRLVAMTYEKEWKAWFSAAAGRRVTNLEIAAAFGVHRNTVSNLADEGLSADQIIQLAEHLEVNPVTALDELGKIEYADILRHVESAGKLLETASPIELVYTLARGILPLSMLIDLGNDGRDRVAAQDQLAERRRRMSALADTTDDGLVDEFDYSEPHAADSSPDETEEMLGRGEDFID